MSDPGVNDPKAPRRRRTWVRASLALVPALAFLAILAFGLWRSSSTAVSGRSAPDFELPLLGQDERLSSDDLEGSPVVVNFWASWCIPCREEAAVLERAWREYRNDGVVFLGVNIKDSEPDALAFMKEYGITYPVVRDLDEVLVRRFGVKGLPETYFIDHEWTFVGTASGPRTGDQQGGTVVLGAISKDELLDNVDILIRRADSDS